MLRWLILSTLKRGDDGDAETDEVFSFQDGLRFSLRFSEYVQLAHRSETLDAVRSGSRDGDLGFLPPRLSVFISVF